MSDGLWGHQEEAIERADAVGGKMLLGMDMGTGKTRTALEMFARHADTSLASKILWVCPKIALNVPETNLREFFPELMTRTRFVPLRSPSGKLLPLAERYKALDEMLKQHHANPDFILMFAIHYDVVWRAALGQRILRTRWDFVVADESQRIRSAPSKVCRFMAKVADRGHPDQQRVALSGTPICKNALDLWGQLRFVQPDLLGRKWAPFRERWAKMGGWDGRQIVGVHDEEKLRELVAPHFFSVRASDCLDLPERVDQHISIEGDSAFKAAYRQMLKTCVAEVNGEKLTAVNAGVQLLRLQQITSSSQAKVAALEEILEEANGEQVVVFCQFKADLMKVSELAMKLGLAYGEISGAHKDLGPDSTYPSDVQVLAVQIDAGGVGIDLTASRIGVMFSHSWRAEQVSQACARLVRPGQTRSVAFYWLRVAGSIDMKLQDVVEGRLTVAEAFASEASALGGKLLAASGAA